ncbi:unnamed protein product [Phaedon cochleariae]|uniref:DUF4780 domain-containing protein n=1 Tax=Phaedon cochleariae TaxID=80249 RepID=A0A9N9X3M4_PHACE|nr:unnamed protein product [Phaedon cochleariae]
MRLVRGHLVFTATDKSSLAWLTETISTIRPWEDVELAVVPVQELPRLSRVHIGIPGRRLQSNQDSVDQSRD